LLAAAGLAGQTKTNLSGIFEIWQKHRGWLVHGFWCRRLLRAVQRAWLNRCYWCTICAKSQTGGGLSRCWLRWESQGKATGEMRRLTILCTLGVLVLLLVLSAPGCRSAAEKAAERNDRGVHLGEEGRYTEAIAEFIMAIREDPEFALAYSNRAHAYTKRGQFDKAIADCDRAIELDPQFALAYSNRAYAYTKKGEFDRAITDCDRAI